MAQDISVIRRDNIATVYNLMDKHKAQIIAALPRHMNPDRMARIALTELRSNPKLQECDPLSFFAAIIKSSQLGLELGLLGEAYLIPRKIKNRMEVCFQPGFKGLRKLAKNTGDVKSISAHCVYENDSAEISLGTEDILVHKPLMSGDRGNLSWVYSVITYKDGTKEFVPMTRQEIEHIRDTHSESYKNYVKNPNWPDGNPKDPPAWITDEAEMWKKTAILRACKQVELSPELKQAIELDVKAETNQTQMLTEDVFDISPPTEPEEKAETKKEELKARLRGRPRKTQEEPPTKSESEELAPSKFFDHEKQTTTISCPTSGDNVFVEWCRDECPEQCLEYQKTLPEPGSEG